MSIPNHLRYLSIRIILLTVKYMVFFQPEYPGQHINSMHAMIVLLKQLGLLTSWTYHLLSNKHLQLLFFVFFFEFEWTWTQFLYHKQFQLFLFVYKIVHILFEFFLLLDLGRYLFIDYYYIVLFSISILLYEIVVLCFLLVLLDYLLLIVCYFVIFKWRVHQ